MKAKTLIPILRKSIAKEANIMTDESSQYFSLSDDFTSYDFVSHQKGEYGRGQIHTNTFEGFYSNFKRRMRGVYQHCSKEHLHRYMAEFDFRYSNWIANKIDDNLRADIALMGVVGKRLTYETIGK